MIKCFEYILEKGATIIYHFALHTCTSVSLFSRVINKVLYKLQTSIIKNIPVTNILNKQTFLCPFSHKLLFYQKLFPLYDRQLPKFCSLLREKLEIQLNIIDVGANVGDSVLNIGIKDAFYLCIEGDESFARYIPFNLKDYNYSVEKYFLSDTNDNLPYGVSSSKGTGHLVKTQIGKTAVVTLDNLIEKKYPDKLFILLKIDTDGFDFKVLRGSKKLLMTQHPFIFFEWDMAFLKEQGEDYLSIFQLLFEYGYTDCILFDNYGNYFNLVKTNNHHLLKKYIEGTRIKGSPFYYDVLAIPDSSTVNIEEICNLFCD